MHTHQTVVGVFSETAMASRAVDDLQRAGFSNAQVSFLDPHQENVGGFLASIRRLFPGHGPEAGAVRDDLTHMGLSKEEVDYYTDEYDAGHALIGVRPDSVEQEHSAMMVLRSDGAYNYRTRKDQTS
jgi:hypothetical protein